MNDGDGRRVRGSVALYRTLAALRYPHALREDFGPDMEADARRLFAEAVERDGTPGLARAWWRLLRDMATPLPARPGHTAGATNDGIHDRRDGGRTMKTTRWVAGTLEDVRFAMRSLRREPRFTTLVVGVLTIGFALNVAVFTVLNAYLIRPLPYPNADRLYAVDTQGTVSWTEADEIFELAVSWDLDAFTILGEGRPELVRGAWVTPDFLQAYDVQAALGRTFADIEAGPGVESVAMISHRIWRDRYGADPGIVGRTFRAFMADRPDESELFTIVGVLPRDFWYFNDYTDILAPIRDERALYTGLLREGVTQTRAEDVLTRLASARLETRAEGFRATIESLQEQYVEAVRPTIVALQIAVLLVLLIACANAGVLLLVRSSRRERELGVRMALGAGRSRVARQLLAEGLLVATAATALGTAAAGLALVPARELVVGRLGRSAPGGLEALALDGTVVLATVGLGLVVGLLFGAVPMVSNALRRPGNALRERSRGATGGRRRAHLRNAMVVTEVALSLALLSGAGLMVRSALHLQSRDLGFDPDGLTRGVVGLREASYPEPEDRHDFFDRLTDELRSRPGIEGAALVRTSPFTNPFNPEVLEGTGATNTTPAVVHTVGDGYFATLGIDLDRGRDFTRDDGPGADPVAIVSESVAASLWPGGEPLGRGVRLVEPTLPGRAPVEPGPFHRVVGVVADIELGAASDNAGGVYVAYRQAEPFWLNVIVRSGPGAPPAPPLLDEVLAGLDPEVPLSGVMDLERTVHEAGAPTRFVATLLGGFAAFAFLLAVVGLYGVVDYAARQRRRDVAIRMALGAERGDVVTAFVVSGLSVVLVGITLGCLGGLLLGRTLEGQLHGVSSSDPVTLAVLAMALLLTSLISVWLPARSAARVEPMHVLRQE